MTLQETIEGEYTSPLERSTVYRPQIKLHQDTENSSLTKT